jgi:shikimate kinase
LLQKRLAADTTRPLLQAADRAKKLSSLLEIRRPLYQQADLQIAIAQNQTPQEITAKLIEQIPTVLKSKATPPKWQ